MTYETVETVETFLIAELIFPEDTRPKLEAKKQRAMPVPPGHIHNLKKFKVQRERYIRLR